MIKAKTMTELHFTAWLESSRIHLQKILSQEEYEIMIGKRQALLFTYAQKYKGNLLEALSVLIEAAPKFTKLKSDGWNEEDNCRASQLMQMQLGAAYLEITEGQ